MLVSTKSCFLNKQLVWTKVLLQTGQVASNNLGVEPGVANQISGAAWATSRTRLWKSDKKTQSTKISVSRQPHSHRFNM